MEMEEVDLMMRRSASEQRHAAVRYAQLWRHGKDEAGGNAVMTISYVIYTLTHLIIESRPDRGFRWGRIQEAIDKLEALLK